MKVMKVILIIALVGLVGVTVGLQKLVHPEDSEPVPLPEQKMPKATPFTPQRKATFLPGQVVSVVTQRGSFKFFLYENDMPSTCLNFVKLAQSGFYNNLKFHRVEDWVIQTGDPLGTGAGGSKNKIKMEVASGLDYATAYMVGMARQGGDLNSANSQWFINKRSMPDLQTTTGPYACFGRVFAGQGVIDKMQKNDVLKKLTVAPPTKEEAAIIAKLPKNQIVPQTTPVPELLKKH